MLKYIISLSFSLFFVLSSSAFGQLEVPADQNFKKIRTAHFDIIFNAKRQDLGLLYAEKLEKAYLYLSHFFSQTPARTVVIINDKTDLTNGYATRIPYPHIMAYPVLPGPGESLADTGDWAFELLAHEYTHVLNFEPAVGAMAWVRAIFGTIAAPNLLLPRWWKEGLAVQMETRLSRHGRLRSIYQDATLRALAESHQLMDFSIAEANEFIPSWPEGARPYLFGSIMWSQMIADRGDAVINTLNLRHGARVPFAVEEPAREAFGRTYPAEYTRALMDTQMRAQAQVKALRALPVTPVQTLTVPAKYLSAPTLSFDGRYLALITVSDTDRREIKILKRNERTGTFVGGEELKTLEEFKEREVTPIVRDGPPTGSIQRVSWFHQGAKIIYDKIDATNRIERFSDLSTYDLQTQKTESLTHGLRAREPSLSPDDQSVAFVKLSGGKTELALLSLKENKSVEVLFSGALQERISSPIFLNANEIIFSLRKDGGRENLYRFNIANKTATPVLTDYPNARFALVTPRGVFFTSSVNGTHNIYLADLNLQKARPVSHTTTAFFSFGFDPVNQDLYSTQMSPHGAEIVRLDNKDWPSTPPALPRIEALFADRYPDPPQLEVPPLKYEIQDYNVGEYLWPRYWIPFFASSTSDTGVVLQAATSAFDPLKKHTYALSGSWDTGLNRGSVQGTYLNQQTSLPVLLSLYQLNTYLSDLNNKITDTGAALSVLPDVFRVNRYLGLQTGWQYFERNTNFGSQTKRTGPFAVISYGDYSQAGEQISPEEGAGAYVGAYNYIQTQNYLAHSQFTAGGIGYLSKFLPERHAIMLNVNGVYTPEEISPIYGVQTSSLPIASDTTLPVYVMRGYKTGQFYGRNLINANLEYRFPIKRIYRGSGTDPLYFQRLSGALIADGVAVDGRYVNDKDQIYEVTTLKRQFFSAGVEAKLSTTIGYTFPIEFVLGYYLALNTPKGPTGNVGLNLQIGAQ